MKKYLKKMFGALLVLVCVTSCSKEDLVQDVGSDLFDKIAVSTEVIIDGVDVTNTRAANEAGYTTGDGLYNRYDPVTVAAHANDGYELVRFYDKDGNASQQNESSYTFPAERPQTFKAEFASKRTISVDIIPAAGGTVAGAGSYATGSTCTLTATPNAGYDFGGWYDGKNLLSASNSYAFTVTASKNITAHFLYNRFILVGSGGIATPTGLIPSVGGYSIWKSITYGNGKYVVYGQNGNTTTSTDGINWTSLVKLNEIYGEPSGNISGSVVAYGNGKFVALASGLPGCVFTSTDGVNWSAPTKIANYTYTDIVFANNIFVASCYSSDAYTRVSTDGVNWTTSDSFGYVRQLHSIAYGNGIFLSGYCNPNGSNIGKLKKSTNGINWDGVSDTPANSIAFGDNKFGLVGNSNGIMFLNGDLSYLNTVGSKSNYQWTKIAYNGGTWFVIDEDGNTARTSNGLVLIEGKKLPISCYDICAMP